MTTDQLKAKNEIIACESKLLHAFTTRDLITLDALIHDDALFVLPTGLTITKSMVLDNYRSGGTAMTSIMSHDQRINFIGDTVVVSVQLELTGTNNDQAINSTFRYLRVWKSVNDQWKVIAVSGVPLNK